MVCVCVFVPAGADRPVIISVPVLTAAAAPPRRPSSAPNGQTAGSWVDVALVRIPNLRGRGRRGPRGQSPQRPERNPWIWNLRRTSSLRRTRTPTRRPGPDRARGPDPGRGDSLEELRDARRKRTSL